MDLKRRSGPVGSPGGTRRVGLPAGAFCLASLLLAAPAALAAGSSAAGSSAAGSSQGTLTLRGVVPAVCTVSLSATSATLDLVQGQAGTAVAAVEESCNAAGGYTVSIASRNGGELRCESAASGVAYSLSYDGADAAKSGVIRTERAATGASRRGTLSLTVPASPTLAAGEYVDTLTVSIAAK